MKKILSILLVLILGIGLLTGCGSSTSEQQVAPGVYAEIPDTWNAYQVDGGGMAYDVLDENNKNIFSCQFFGPYEQTDFPTVDSLLYDLSSMVEGDFYEFLEPTNIESFYYEENGKNQVWAYFDSGKYGSHHREYILQNNYNTYQISAESQSGDFTEFEKMLETLYFKE